VPKARPNVDDPTKRVKEAKRVTFQRGGKVWTGEGEDLAQINTKKNPLSEAKK